ncbi:MAG TPA: tripartite tricarboxylate transporter substrate binding protein [Burkholderiales bacterium]|nr:tripartite tricarboxylate transporter substrate binding protein [Burkholderiales bacterium]
MRLLLALLLALGVASAGAQTWPQKPVKLVVPFPPGGVTDSMARITAEWLSQKLGQPVVAENKPGASGAIAAEAVARSAPDGYTLFMAASPQLVIVPHVQKIAYDPIRDFAPVSIVGENMFALGVHDKFPARTLGELVQYAKARPGELNFASAGTGTVSHLTMALFLARAGLKIEPVLYKGGGPAIADVLAGQVPMYFGNLNEFLPHVGGGRIRVLAVSGARRAAQLPDTPTVAEQGFPGFHTETWNGVVAPAGTPPEAIERIQREIATGCRDAGFAARLAKIGVDPVCSTPAEFARTIRQDLELWREGVRAAGMKME